MALTEVTITAPEYLKDITSCVGRLNLNTIAIKKDWTSSSVCLNTASKEDIENIKDVDLGKNGTNLIDLKALYEYHRLLMKSMSAKLEANICTRCGGLLDDELKCIFCGAQHRLVTND